MKLERMGRMDPLYSGAQITHFPAAKSFCFIVSISTGILSLVCNRGLNNVGTVPQRPHSYGPLPLQGVGAPQPAYYDQLLPSTGSQMNNMNWENTALHGEQFNLER